jgi:hypothetical protein
MEDTKSYKVKHIKRNTRSYVKGTRGTLGVVLRRSITKEDMMMSSMKSCPSGKTSNLVYSGAFPCFLGSDGGANLASKLPCTLSLDEKH